VVAYGARRVSLSDKIIVSDLKVGESQVSVERVNVTFLPPDPVTNIYYDSSATSTVLEIELTEVQSGSKKTVQVNFLGLAEVID